MRVVEGNSRDLLFGLPQPLQHSDTSSTCLILPTMHRDHAVGCRLDTPIVLRD